MIRVGIDQWMCALMLWLVAAHPDWWNFDIMLADVPGIRTAARCMFYVGCGSIGFGVLAAILRWFWKESGLAKAWAEEKRERDLRELALLKEKYEK